MKPGTTPKRYDRPLTLEEMANIRDEDIDFSDIPELDEEWFKQAKVASGNLVRKSGVVVDDDLIAWFREQGGDTTKQINAVLRAHIERERAKNPKQAAE